MESKVIIPKRCLSWKNTAAYACNAMDEPTICRDLADALFVQCVKNAKKVSNNHKK